MSRNYRHFLFVTNQKKRGMKYLKIAANCVLMEEESGSEHQKNNIALLLLFGGSGLEATNITSTSPPFHI